MPDFERLTDSLRVFAAKDSASRQWNKGYMAGKKEARLQIVFVVVAAVFLVACYQLSK